MNADVKASTKVFGVIGFPVHHSLSPRMQNAALRAAGIDGVYVALPVEPGLLAVALAGLGAAGVKGVNLTVPHKEEASRLVDSLTPEAMRAGAVNTIAWRNGKTEGHNTDGSGFIRAAERLTGTLKGKTVLVFGSGGAGRGIVAALSAAGVTVRIVNRTREKAEILAREVVLPAGSVVTWEPEAVLQAARNADLLVNASSAGMHDQGGLPLEFAKLEVQPAVIDLVYAPLETRFLKEARKFGCRVQDGHAMLAAQGELAFEFWHGISAPAGVMEKALREAVATPPI